MRDWIEKLKNPSTDPYERRFRLFAPLGMLLVIVWLVIISVLDFDPFRLGFYVVMITLYGGTLIISVRTGRIREGAVICACGMIFVLMPYVFFREGGVQAGAFNYSISCLIFVLMTVRGRSMIFLIAADLGMISTCYALSYLHPERVQVSPHHVTYVNAYTEMIIAFILALCAIAMQLVMFRQERETLETQRREIQKLNESQNRFFSSMSHEIRTPINTIIGLNEMILRDPENTEEVISDAHNISGASRMLLTLINDILDMSKIESGQMDIVPVTYDTGSMLSEVVNMVWGRAQEKGLQFHVDVDETLPAQLFGDEVRIRQVLINLLNNAVKYTSEGSVRFSVQCDRMGERKIRVNYRVEDTGMGIKREAMPYLFDAFKRVDQEKNRNIEGTGLGLSIVKQIVDLMGGEITVDSIYTKGSTFAVSLTQEIADETAVGTLRINAGRTVRERTVYQQSFEAPGARILIVDDNELNLQVESKLLSDTRMTIDLAASGAECLTRTFRNKYDVILMDHLMPEMDGIECLKEIRSQRGGLNRETPVIALTANAGSENQALYAMSGFDGYLLKPVTGQQLEAALLKTLPPELVMMTGAAVIQSERESIVGQHRRMKRILVSCESGIDLPKELIRRYNIPVISFHIRTNEGVFYDSLDVDSDSLLEYLENPAHNAQTEAPTVDEYERFFAENLEQAQHLVHITYARNTTAGYDRAVEAAASFGNVTVMDSDALSAGTGMLVLYAAHLSESEDDINAFLAQVERVRSQIQTSFVVESTEYMARSGRISMAAHTVARSFMLHPVTRVRRHTTVTSRVIFGDTETFRRRYIRHVLRSGGDVDPSLAILTYVGLSEEELSSIREMILEEIAFHRIVLQKASSAVAANVGRGTFGLMFSLLEDENDTMGKFAFLPEDLGKESEKEHEEETPAQQEPEEVEEETAATVLRETGSASGKAEGGIKGFYQGTELLHYDEAARYLGNDEMITKTLELFYRSIAKKADEIEQMLNEDDFENYTVKVHALKSSARMIGATALSEKARILEEYGHIVGN